MITAVIFDFDATLADSEPNYFEAERRMLADFGVAKFTMEDKKKYIGRGSSEVVRDLAQEYGITEPLERLMELKTHYYLELARENTPIFPEMRKLLKLLEAEKIPLAVASGTPLAILQELLQCTGIAGYFQIVLSSEQVAHGKPAPDLFIKAAEELCVAPENCLVFEDSCYGVQAAKSAGMACVAIPYMYEEQLDESYFTADWLLTGGMAEFDAERTLGWMARQQAE